MGAFRSKSHHEELREARVILRSERRRIQADVSRAQENQTRLEKLIRMNAKKGDGVAEEYNIKGYIRGKNTLRRLFAIDLKLQEQETRIAECRSHEQLLQTMARVGRVVENLTKKYRLGMYGDQIQKYVKQSFLLSQSMESVNEAMEDIQDDPFGTTDDDLDEESEQIRRQVREEIIREMDRTDYFPPAPTHEVELHSSSPM